MMPCNLLISVGEGEVTEILCMERLSGVWERSGDGEINNIAGNWGTCYEGLRRLGQCL